MWLMKYAERPENELQYRKAIEMITEKSNVTKKEIDDYYEQAIKNKIYSTPLGKPLILAQTCLRQT
jgi:hypothetical protein